MNTPSIILLIAANISPTRSPYRRNLIKVRPKIARIKNKEHWPPRNRAPKQKSRTKCAAFINSTNIAMNEKRPEMCAASSNQRKRLKANASHKFKGQPSNSEGFSYLMARLLFLDKLPYLICARRRTATSAPSSIISQP